MFTVSVVCPLGKKNYRDTNKECPLGIAGGGDKEGRCSSEVLLDSLVFLLFPCQRAVLEHAQWRALCCNNSRGTWERSHADLTSEWNTPHCALTLPNGACRRLSSFIISIFSVLKSFSACWIETWGEIAILDTTWWIIWISVTGIWIFIHIFISFRFCGCW